MSDERRKENRFILLTDIIGHTKMFARVGPAFRKMRERHDQLFMDAVRAHDPKAIVKGAGDGFYAGFEHVEPAVEVALAFRRALAAEDWHTHLPPDKRTAENVIRCRIGLHSGVVSLLGPEGAWTDIDGQPRSVAEKLMGMAGANQILVSRPARDAARLGLSTRADLQWQKYGEFKVRDVPDTVEVWGLSADDFPPGARPVQPPEHRVILFCTIHDYTTMLEQLGPRFMAQKDVWDSEFAKAAGAHAKDAFIKRLPDGTLASFKTAVEAIRAGRDFRRGLKNAGNAGTCTLIPKIALESGLVTFEYENNAAIDVRDQPVNIPAKMVKTGLVATWQLLMTRPVREDAWANLPEREEFRWVCLGQKQVVGEPEPVEIWEFHDVQVKAETRTLVWIDARDAKRTLANKPEELARFEGRLGEMAVMAITQRAEEPWLLPTEMGLAMAFKDPIEAVLAARDLHKAASEEHWERVVPSVKRAGRSDNLLRLALHLGQVKITLEDGLLKEFKGPSVDGVRPIADACKNSQVLLSRELRDVVATGFAESEVELRKIEAQGAVAIEAYELRSAKKSNKSLLVGGGVAVVALIGLALVLGGVFNRPGPNDPNGGGVVSSGGGGWKAGEELPPDVDGVLTDARSNDDLRGAIGEIKDLLMQQDRAQAEGGKVAEERKRDLAAAAERVKDMAKKWGPVISPSAAAEHLTTLRQAKDMAGLNTWFDGLASFERLPEGGDPRKSSEWTSSLDTMSAQLKAAGRDEGEAAAQVAEAGERVKKLAAMAWVKKNEQAVQTEAAQITALVRDGGTLAAAVATDVKSAGDARAAQQSRLIADAQAEAAREAAKGQIPEKALFAILVNERSANEALRDVGKAARSVVQAFVADNPTMTADQRTAALKPLADAIGALPQDQALDLVALKADGLAGLAGVKTPEQMVAWAKSVEQYRRPEGADPRTAGEWRRQIDDLRRRMADVRASDPQVEQSLDRAGQQITTLAGIAWVKKNEAEVRAQSQAIAGKLTGGGEVAKAVDLLVSGKKEEAAAQVAAYKLIDEKLAAPVVDPTEWPALANAWRDAGTTFRQKREQADGAALKTLGEQVEKASAMLAGLPKMFDVQVPGSDTPGWARDLRDALKRQRDEALGPIMARVGSADAAELARLDEQAKAQAVQFAANADAVRKLAADLGAVEAAMNRGEGLDAKLPDGKTMAAVVDSALQIPIAKAAGVVAAIAPVVDRVTVLKKIAAAASVGELRTIALEAKRSTPEATIAAWKKLGTVGLSGTDAWLEAQTDVYREMSDLSGIRDAAQRQAIKDAARAELPGRWLAYFASLTDEPNIKRALARRADFGITDADQAKLPAYARYNWRLALLKDAARSPESPEMEEALRKTVEGFTKQDWAGVQGQAAAQALLTGLKDPMAAAATPAAAFDPSKIDPKLIGPGLAGWKLVNQSGDVYTYEMEVPEGGKLLKGEPVRLDFVRLSVPEQSGAQSVVFVSTTEMSLRQFIEIVEKAKGWSKLRAAYTDGADRKGPYLWTWPSGRERPMDLIDDMVGGKRSWVGKAPILNTKSYYPEGMDIPEPALDDPMQYVSPLAAGYVARLMNCRLPSSAEWNAALRAEGSGADPNGWNLRDQSLKRVVDQFNKQMLPGVNSPDQHSFQRVAGDKKFYDFDDGVVWFVPVTTDVGGKTRKFHHLIGNVGEIVFDKPELFEGMRIGVLDDTAKVLDDKDNRAAVMVIGGSALSQRLDGDALTSPQNISSVRKGMFETGRADVGFRVAFSPVAGGAAETYAQAVLKLTDAAVFLSR